MTIRLLDYPDPLSATARRVSRLDEMAQGICDQAVASARVSLGAEQRPAALDELVDRPGFADHVLRGLAVGVAQALAANDQRVMAVYAHGPAPDGSLVAEVQDEPGPRLHLLVRVTAPSAALEAFVASLERALGASLRALPHTRLGRAAPLLDISIVSEREVKQQVGMARLLAGLRPAPVKLWERQS